MRSSSGTRLRFRRLLFVSLLCSLTQEFTPVLAQPSVGPDQDVPSTDCDKYAASDVDPNRKGPGVAFGKIDTSLAIMHCKNALEIYPNSGRLAFQLGRAYHQAGEHSSALTYHNRAYDNGYELAIVSLGFFYKNGLGGVVKDEPKAFLYFHRGAEKGSSVAQLNLGDMYRLAQGTPRDDASAVRWYRRAAEQDNTLAQSKLGWMCEHGVGLAKDEKQASVWYRKAAEKGDVYAQTNLGLMYAHGRGVAKDVSQALTLLKKAADSGHPQAQFHLASMFEAGLAGEQARSAAVGLYRKAAEQSHPEAQRKLQELDSYTAVKHDPNDVVAQVLNYSMFGSDEGVGENFWYKAGVETCRYRLHLNRPQRSNNSIDNLKQLNELLAYGVGAIQRKEIDLDQLDPKNIKIRLDRNPAIWGRGEGTIVQHIEEVLTMIPGRLDMERLERGWNLIFRTYCRGKAKPF